MAFLILNGKIVKLLSHSLPTWAIAGRKFKDIAPLSSCSQLITESCHSRMVGNFIGPYLLQVRRYNLFSFHLGQEWSNTLERPGQLPNSLAVVDFLAVYWMKPSLRSWVGCVVAISKQHRPTISGRTMQEFRDGSFCFYLGKCTLSVNTFLPLSSMARCPARERIYLVFGMPFDFIKSAQTLMIRREPRLGNDSTYEKKFHGTKAQ